jgi:hypothetical protein
MRLKSAAGAPEVHRSVNVSKEIGHVHTPSAETGQIHEWNSRFLPRILERPIFHDPFVMEAADLCDYF